MTTTTDDTTPTIARGLPIAVVRGVLFFLGTAILAHAVMGDDANPFDGSNTALLLVAALLTVDAVGTNLALWKVGRQNPQRLGWHLDHVARDVVIGVVGFGVCAVIVYAVIYGFAGKEGVDETVANIVGFTTRQRFEFFVIGIFGASVAEESLYRGYLQPALINKLGPIGGILLTSVLFSVLHLNPHPISLITKAALGATYGVVAWRTKGLVAPAVTHALVWWVIGAS